MIRKAASKPMVQPIRPPFAPGGFAAPATLALWDEPSSPRPAGGLLDPRGALLFLRRNLLRILLVAGVVAVLGVGACYVLLNSFSATALVMIDPRDEKVTQTQDVLANIGPDTIAIESLVQVANSDDFLGRVVDRLNLMADPDFAGQGASEALRRSATIDKLRTRLKIGRRGTTYLVDVTATTKDAARSATLANTVADMLAASQANLRSSSNAGAAEFLDGKLDALRERLHTAEMASAALKAKLNITDAGQGGTLQERRIAELNQQLILATARAAEAQARVDELTRAGSAAPDRLSAALPSPVLAGLRQDYARLMRQAAEQRAIYGDRYPAVQSLAAQIADLRHQIAAEIGRLVAAARGDAQEAAGRVGALTADLRRAQADSGRQGSDRVKLDEIDREARADRTVYEQLLDRQKQLSELHGLTPTDVRVVSEALPSARPNRPSLSILAGVFALLGLGAGCFFALARETLRRTMVTRSQAERLSGVEVTGLVPLVPARAVQRPSGTPVLPPDLSPWMSDLRRLAAPSGADQGRVVLVTSARPGEGKTAIARNLARSLAGSGETVLLLEASAPRQPPSSPQFGLLDVVAEGCAPDRAFVDVPHLGLTRLPFGGLGRARPEALDGTLSASRLSAVIGACRGRFDVVVVDGPAVREAGYATTLAATADLSLVVVEWDATDGADLVEALDRLRPDDVTLVFNKVEVRRYARYEPSGIERLRRTRGVDAAAA